MHDRINVGLVHDGTAGNRFLDVTALWAGGRIWERRGFTLDLIDPTRPSRSAPLPHDDDEALRTLQRRLARADALVIVTPAQGREIPAAIRTVIDCAGVDWEDKPVGFVACGDPDQKSSLLEQLRFLFAQLQTVTLEDPVRLDRARTRFDADGEPAAADPAHEAMDTLLTQLHRRAMLRRDARNRPHEPTPVKAGSALQDNAATH